MKNYASATTSHSELDTGSITAIIAGIVAVLTTIIGGWWQWMSGRKKTEADAQVTVVSGFISLITQLQAERVLMIARINELERGNQNQGHRIALLERLLNRNNIDIPKEDAQP